MRVLILGAGGMLGHKVWQIFRDRFDCRAAVRTRLPLALFDDDRIMAGIDAADFERVTRLIGKVRPDAVINCVGVVKQLAAAHDPIASITLNSLFPHVVARACGEVGARMIHISTDCVFAGTRGNYRESDAPDAADLYGRSKLLGEVVTEAQTRVSVPHSLLGEVVTEAQTKVSVPHSLLGEVVTEAQTRVSVPHLTIRTSIIGRELRTANGLVEWFLLNRGGAVRGFTKAVFSGVTTTTLAETLADVIEHHPDLNGLYHVAGAAITKYDLLVMLNEAFGAGAAITADDSVVIDRTLDAARFSEATGLGPPAWREMIAALAAESPQYERWRTTE
ncbi:MAG TPA: SDR family oxidoreductase [Thermoanaerobaculia bacterium]|nr:SDR family oxidoreductase [Thermoanaerobaculia bacterium]